MEAEARIEMRRILRLLGCYLLGKHEDIYELFPVGPGVWITRTTCKVCGEHWIGHYFEDEDTRLRLGLR